jgi:hypothetical protein
MAQGDSLEYFGEKNLCKAGTGSWNLLLPKTWLKLNGLENGGTVELYLEDGKLIIKKKKDRK